MNEFCDEKLIDGSDAVYLNWNGLTRSGVIDLIVSLIVRSVTVIAAWLVQS